MSSLELNKINTLQCNYEYQMNSCSLLPVYPIQVFMSCCCTKQEPFGLHYVLASFRNQLSVVNNFR